MQEVLKKRYKEVFFIKPNNLGISFLDRAFHLSVPYLKSFPWLVFFPLAFLFSLGLIILLRAKAIDLVSLLQYGF